MPDLLRQTIDRIQTDGHEVLYAFRAGSHLFGTTTSRSDTDFVVVFAPDPRQVLSGGRPKSYRASTNPGSGRNTSADVDVQTRNAIEMVNAFAKAETNAVDAVFAPTNTEAMVYEKRTFLADARARRLCIRSLDGLLGYVLHQAAKYGLKGSRLYEARTLLQLAETASGEKVDVLVPLVRFANQRGGLRHVQVKTVRVGDEEREGIEVLGRTILPTESVDRLVERLRYWIGRYGKRAREAEQNRGVDWKALSHAYRSIVEAEQYLERGEVRFPFAGEDLKNMLAIKRGELGFTLVRDLLEERLQALLDAELPPCEPAPTWEIVYPWLDL